MRLAACSPFWTRRGRAIKRRVLWITLNLCERRHQWLVAGELTFRRLKCVIVSFVICGRFTVAPLPQPWHGVPTYLVLMLLYIKIGMYGRKQKYIYGDCWNLRAKSAPIRAETPKSDLRAWGVSGSPPEPSTDCQEACT